MKIKYFLAIIAVLATAFLGGLFLVANIQAQTNSATKPSITVTSPNGGETWYRGETHNITWQSKGVNKVYIFRYKYDSAGKKSDTYVIANGITASLGKYSWTIPSKAVGGENINVKTTRIVISSAPFGTAGVSDMSDKYFDVAAPATTPAPTSASTSKPTTTTKPTATVASPVNSSVPPTMEVIYPDGGEILEAGKTYEIKWRATNMKKIVAIVWGRGGQDSSIIAKMIDPVPSSYSWTIPEGVPTSSSNRIIISGLPPDDVNNLRFVSSKASGIYNWIDKKKGIDTRGYITDWSDADFYITSNPNSTYHCKPFWQCGDWGVCSSGQQARTCVDFVKCGVNINKPAETQVCNVLACIPNWQTGSWGACINGQQIRIVTDLNNCGVSTNKPNETNSCEIGQATCIPNWTCTDWPSYCATTISMRTCTDSNNCGVATNKPEEQQICKQCNDSDGGKDYFKQGTTNTLWVFDPKDPVDTMPHSDVCDSANKKLTEYYCDEKKAVKSEEVDCPYGCEAGACKKTDAVQVDLGTRKYCIDTDGNSGSDFNFYERGLVISNDGSDSGLDICLTDFMKTYLGGSTVSSQGMLDEFYGDKASEAFRATKCKQQYDASVCGPLKNKLLESTCSGMYGWDDGGELTQGNEYPIFNCPNGCKNGACIKKGKCTPKWECDKPNGEWTKCIGGKRTRDCVEVNGCGTSEGRPEETQSCAVSADGKCTDTDGGNNIFAKGTVVDKNGTFTDKCQFTHYKYKYPKDFNCLSLADALEGVGCAIEQMMRANEPYEKGFGIEYFCDQRTGNVSSAGFGCPNGGLCKDGACAKDPETVCKPKWICTEWWPFCNGLTEQGRLCEDNNHCGVTTGKPIETQICAATACVSDWNCTPLGPCVNSQQTRTCADSNKCAVATNKPIETYDCAKGCGSNWSCAGWSNCIRSSQTRACTDLNKCGTTTGKPYEMQYCSASTTLCADSNWTYSLSPLICPSSGQQTKTWTSIGTCAGGVSHPETEIVACNYQTPTPACISWTYSDWSDCNQSGVQTRTVASSSPSGCSGGNPITSQTCATTPACADSNWTYSLSPSICPSSSQQTKTWISIGTCAGGVSHPATETVACNYQTPTCTSFTYSDWSTCNSSGTQTRTVASSSPTGCAGGNPITSQTCVVSYTLTTSAANGTITKNPDQATYYSGTYVYLTATANSSYNFTGWTGDGSGTTNPLTVTMNANKSVTANFTNTSASCADTDGGKDYYTKGTVSYVTTNGVNGTAADLCEASNLLLEYYCDPTAYDHYRSDEFFCPNGYGCSNGACNQTVALAPAGGNSEQSILDSMAAALANIAEQIKALLAGR